MKLGTWSLLTIVACGVAGAHHSYAMFDRSTTTSITGTVREFEWTNPHIYLWVTVTGQDGEQRVWGVEGGAPVMLARHGWNKNSVAPGDKVTVELNPLRDGRPGGYFLALIRADGVRMTGDGATTGSFQGTARPSGSESR